MACGKKCTNYLNLVCQEAQGLMLEKEITPQGAKDTAHLGQHRNDGGPSVRTGTLLPMTRMREWEMAYVRPSALLVWVRASPRAVCLES